MTSLRREDLIRALPYARRYARALTRDADIADDLVQDTLVRALRSERLFLGGDIRSWLYTILTNLNRNRRRSLARMAVKLSPLRSRSINPFLCMNRFIWTHCNSFEMCANERTGRRKRTGRQTECSAESNDGGTSALRCTGSVKTSGLP